MPVTSKDLLDHLSDLQLALEDYSFDKMTVEEASRVKESYDHFRNQLETCIWGAPGEVKIPEQQVAQTTHMEPDGVLSAIGHDLRNPLHGIIGFARVLAEAPLEEPYRSIAASVRMASESMSDTLDELCAFSRIKDTPTPEVSIAFSLTALLQEVRDYAHLKLLDKPVRIDLDMGSEIPESVLGNPSDLRRILLNLIENACRYTPKGEIRMLASLSKRNTKAELCIEISDTGIGIPEVELPHIFKPYYQGKQAMELAALGAGFGLSIVRQLVIKHDGRILVESTEGQGSIVKLTLPCTLGSTQGRIRTPKRIQKMESDILKGKRILIIENNPLNLKVLETRLKVMGCLLFSVADVSEAIELLESEPLDILLLDLRLHKDKDRKALKAIRTHQNPYIRRFPILGMSADLPSASEGQWSRIGIDGLLSKPHTAEALYQKISDLSHESQPASDAAQTLQRNEDKTVSLVDLSYLKTKCKGDIKSLNLLVGALRNGMLEFAGRTRIGLNQGDFKSISEGAEKLIIALEMIKAQSLLPIVQQIRQASLEGGDKNRIIRAFSAYLSNYPEVAEALERHMHT